MNLEEARKRLPELEGLSDPAAIDVIHEVYYPQMDKAKLAGKLGYKAPPAPAPERSTMRAAGDLALQFGGGAVSGVRMMSDLLGANNAVSGTLRNAEDALQKLQSAAAQADQQQIAAIMKEAESKGFVDQVLAGVKAFGVAPAAMVAQALGTSLPTLATAAIPGAGPMALAARLGAAGAVGAGQGAGNIKGVIYDQVKANPLPGEAPEQTEARAVDAQSYTGENADQIALGGGLGLLAGATGMERAVGALRNGVAKAAPGMAARVGLGAAGEAVPEALQGGQEKLAGNLALGREGFDVDPMSGVVAGGTMEALAGGVMGGATALPRPAVRTPDPISQAGDAIRSAEVVPESGPMTRAANVATEMKAQQAEADVAAQVAAIEPAEPAPVPAQPVADDPVAQPVAAVSPVEAAPVDASDAAQEQRANNALASMERQAQRDMQSMRDFSRTTPATSDVPDPFADVPVAGGAPAAAASGDVLNPKGEPFKTRMAAQRATKKTPGDVVPVAGGFVVRPTISQDLASEPTQGTPDAAAVAPFDAGAAPAVEPGAGPDAGEAGAAALVRPAEPEQPAALIAQAPAMPAAESDWQVFPADTETLNVPRAEMPQIKAAHRGAMVNFLKARGIEHEADEVAANTLKPTQAEFSISKVKKAQDFGDPDRSILVSADGYVVDGHHQWIARGANGASVKVIRLKAPISELLPAVREFPSSTVDETTADVQNATQEPAGEAAQAANTETTAPAGSDGAATEGVSPEGSSPVEAAGVKDGAAPESDAAHPPQADASPPQQTGQAPEPEPEQRTPEKVVARRKRLIAERKASEIASPAQEATKEAPATEAPAPSKPKAKRQTAASRQAEAEAARAGYFTPGHVVRGYGGFDEVLAYNPTDGGGFSVTVHEVKRVGDEWHRVGKPQDARTHSTQPEDRLLKNGPFARLSYRRAGEVVYTSPRADGQPFPNAVDRGVAPPAEKVAEPDPAPAPKAERAAAPKSAAPVKIEDFGEKLAGARKDYAAQLKDAEALDVSAVPLSQSWPEPDYQKLLEGGADPFTVAFIHAARDEVPNKPQTAWKLKGWVPMVNALRGMSHMLLAGRATRQSLTDMLSRADMRSVRDGVASRAELYEAVGHDRSLKGLSFAEHHYSLYKGQPNVRKWVVSQRSKSTAFGNWPRELAVGDTKAAMLEQFTAKLVAQDINGVSAKAKPSFVIYGKRGQKGAFIGKKIGREYIDLHKADDVVAARRYMAENTAALEKALERYKETPFERKSENAPRVGGDHRNGAPVTPEVFGDTFGFRGVQFGNYVEQGRRQSDLNEAFDALMDMAAVLDLPPRALSLNGRLGLAFGARGKGGKNAPVAHYEPSSVVINLTKGGGPGSLAHEWFHAMDNYFAKEGGDIGFMTDAARGDALRAEMREAFMVIKRAMNQGELKKRSLELDKRRSKPYWSTSLEMAARSFESYVIAKLYDQGAANDYLANVVSPEYWAAEEAMREVFEGKKAGPTFPYPTVDEMPALRAAFDDFFKVVQTRKDDDGKVAMFSRAEGAPKGISPAQASSIVSALSKRWANAPEVVVVSSIQDEAVPVEVREHDLEQRSLGASGEPEGFWYDGKAYVVAGALNGPADVVRVLFHEALGHYGLRGTFGEGLTPILKQLIAMRRPAVEAKAAQYGLQMSNEEHRMQAAEEVLAEMAQSRPGLGFVKRAIAAVRAWLRTHVPGFASMKLTDTDIISQFILPARRFVENGAARQQGGVEPAMAFSKAERNALDEISRMDEMFAVPKSNQLTLEGIFADLAPQIQVKRGHAMGTQTTYRLTLPIANKGDGLITATVTVREPNPYGASVYGVEFDAENEIMEASTVRPGENPADLSPDMADVWIDVSSLPQGSGLGEIIYSAAANFAHNTGRVFIGDPNGLSAVALRRRTEQMISSALKFGTTDHLAPHPDQVKGDTAAGVPALRWVYGDSEGNIERMIDVSLQSIENALPSAKLIGYDAASNKFFRIDTGARLPFRSAIAGVVNAQSLGRAIDGRRPDGLGRAADRAGQGVDAGAASAGSAGWRTVARAALFRYLREAQGVAADGADRGSLLDRLRDAGARLGREGPVASGGASAEPIFYSRSAGNSNGLSAETGARFSRSLTESINNVRSMALPAGYVVNDLFQSTGKLSWWNKTVGTMYNLAQRERDFKPVFDKAQEFLNDVAFYAAEASNLAPKILPKLETLKDITKSPISAADNKAISAPIFEGTLTWMRDPSTRKPITMEEAEAKAASMTTEQKAGELVRKGMLAPEVLKMWQGQPVDQYTAMVSDRYERDMLNAGIVWTDAELKGQFKLSDDQVALYREFRAAVDKSLSTLAIADMVRFGGQDVQPVRELALEAESVDAAAKLLRDFLLAEAEADPARKRVLTDTADRMLDKAAKANSLMERGYAPLSRFGRYSLDVVDAGGERVYFGLFESQAQANKMARQMRGNFPKASITQGTVSQEAYKMFAGVSPETLELFGQLVGLEAKGDGALNEVFQQYLKNAKSQRSAMKRLIQRKGISGFSEDPGRVLAGFVYSNARQTSSSLHMGELATAVDEIPKTKGELKDMAVKLNDYVKNPQEEAQALRGLLFAQYLGGSVSSALLNALQPVQVTFPWLSQFGGGIKAASRMKRAISDVLARRELEPTLAKALKKAEEDGVVSPQEVFQLQAQAAGRAPLLTSDGTRLGAAGAAANNTLSRVTLAWGKLFGAAEQFNRRSTYIAAYRTAVEQGMGDPAKFAERAVYETQFVYSKANRPQWARGAVGATLFTFKQYSISYVELMHRMYTQGGPEGKKAALLGIAVLFLMSGLGGLPFNDDLEDLIDGFMQRVMNRNFNTKQAKREFFTNLLGANLANFLERGVSGLPGAPIDVSGRLGLGNLIPGTGVFQKKDDYSRDLLEIVGPAGDFAKRGGQAAGKALQGEVLGARGALATVSPVASRNAIKGWEMATTGMYLDDRGRKVLDSSGMDALFKSIGIQPAGVAQVQESVFEVQRQISLNKMRETEIANKWAMGVFRKDSDLVREARSELAAWNRDNPSTPIVIKMPQILKRVRQMNLNKADRIAKTAPTEIRSQVRDALREAQR
jgi:hypothetical protein